MNLTDLAIECKTDKWGGHFYTPHYERHLAHLKDKPVTFLEIGIGGYDSPTRGGQSLQMWSRWFTHPKTTIIGVDIQEKTLDFADPRVKIHQGSQVDTAFLDRLHELYGDFDAIIDDGSHVPAHVIETFEHLYPKVRNGGVYIVEDTQTSYWARGEHRYKTCNPDNPTMTYFSKVPDWINYAENPVVKEPTFFERHTTGIHFYHNLIVIDKDLNEEKSNTFPSKLLDKRKAHFAAPLITAPAQAGPALSLSAHIGRFGDIRNPKAASVVSDGSAAHGIQGFVLHCEAPEWQAGLEYRARFANGSWSDWVRCGEYAGSRGRADTLTGFTVRLQGPIADRFTVRAIGAFVDHRALVSALSGQDCIPQPRPAALYGMQVIVEAMVSAEKVSAEKT